MYRTWELAKQDMRLTDAGVEGQDEIQCSRRENWVIIRVVER